jgi:hypothetical protein
MRLRGDCNASQNTFRGQSPFEQRNRRATSRSRTRRPGQGRSASVRTNRLWIALVRSRHGGKRRSEPSSGPRRQHNRLPASGDDRKTPEWRKKIRAGHGDASYKKPIRPSAPLHFTSRQLHQDCGRATFQPTFTGLDLGRSPWRSPKRLLQPFSTEDAESRPERSPPMTIAAQTLQPLLAGKLLKELPCVVQLPRNDLLNRSSSWS